MPISKAREPAHTYAVDTRIAECVDTRNPEEDGLDLIGSRISSLCKGTSQLTEHLRFEEVTHGFGKARRWSTVSAGQQEELRLAIVPWIERKPTIAALTPPTEHAKLPIKMGLSIIRP